MKTDELIEKGVKFPKYPRQRQCSFPPPTLITQLHFKIEEEENDGEESEEETVIK